ncbi:hypothetical protein [Bifidobacterium colobi]|uniref:hypothetical protein n=1 Tax=Bifidobacterium colobi TaxID=2809026 RepID=UPI001BDBDA77|nr:hypothetical protein [Bifidobacterium colobi]
MAYYGRNHARHSTRYWNFQKHGESWIKKVDSVGYATGDEYVPTLWPDDPPKITGSALGSSVGDIVRVGIKGSVGGSVVGGIFDYGATYNSRVDKYGEHDARQDAEWHAGITTASGVVGGVAGVAAGTVTGAIVGSSVPIVGTAVGAVVGCVVSTVLGNVATNMYDSHEHREGKRMLKIHRYYFMGASGQKLVAWDNKDKRFVAIDSYPKRLRRRLRRELKDKADNPIANQKPVAGRHGRSRTLLEDRYDKGVARMYLLILLFIIAMACIPLGLRYLPLNAIFPGTLPLPGIVIAFGLGLLLGWLMNVGYAAFLFSDDNETATMSQVTAAYLNSVSVMRRTLGSWWMRALLLWYMWGMLIWLVFNGWVTRQQWWRNEWVQNVFFTPLIALLAWGAIAMIQLWFLPHIKREKKQGNSVIRQ